MDLPAAPDNYSLRMDNRPISLVGNSLPSPPTALEIIVYPLASTPPLAVRALLGPQSSTVYRRPKGFLPQILPRKRRQRYESLGTSDGRHDKTEQVVEDRTGNQFAEGPGVSIVRSSECTQVLRPVTLEDDRRRIPQPHQQQIHQEAASPPIAVEEGMDTLELCVQVGNALNDGTLL